MRHVLIVDDDPDVCEVIGLALQAEGTYRITTTTSGNDATAVISRELPDLAIVDMVLKGGSGLQLAAHALDNNIPVLLISGHPGTMERLALAGCHFLAKPFHIAALLAETRALLDDENQRRTGLTLQLRSLATRRE